jgi:hypothetical protein
VNGMDKPQACPRRPQQNRSRRSGHMMCYQNRTTPFAIDRLCRPSYFGCLSNGRALWKINAGP